MMSINVGVRFDIGEEDVRFHHPWPPEFWQEAVNHWRAIGGGAFDAMLVPPAAKMFLARKGTGRAAVDF